MLNCRRNCSTRDYRQGNNNKSAVTRLGSLIMAATGTTQSELTLTTPSLAATPPQDSSRRHTAVDRGSKRMRDTKTGTHKHFRKNRKLTRMRRRNTPRRRPTRHWPAAEPLTLPTKSSKQRMNLRVIREQMKLKQ